MSPGITRIAVSGFKSLAEKVDVEIRPLTILAGANSSGKSALMQPVLLMKQTLESDVVPEGPFLLSGPYARYTDAGQFLSRPSLAREPARLSVDFEAGEEFSLGMTFGSDADSSFGLLETRGRDSIGGPDLSMPWHIDRESTSDYLGSLEPLLTTMFAGRGLTSHEAERYKFFHQVRASAQSTLSLQDQYWIPIAVSRMIPRIQRTIYITGARGQQPRTWLSTAVPPSGIFEGPFESYVPSIVYSWQRIPRGREIALLRSGLLSLKLAGAVRAEKPNESEIDILVPRTLTSPDDDFVNVADVGRGVSSTLSVLVALIQAEPDQLVFIEHPELNLHPRAQWNLAQLLVQAANRGVRLVIETHSSLLLQGILTCVAKGEIAPTDVALHWFARDNEGVTHVESVHPDKAGRVGDWPEDFSDVELKSSNAYLDAVSDRLLAEKK